MEGFLNPNQVLGHLKLKSNMVAADFGSGSGGWVIPLAKILQSGSVYAIDILEEPLSALRSKVNLEKIGNVRTIRSNIENENGSTLHNSSVDSVLITNLLFQTRKKKEIFEEAKRILKSGGKILVVDWKEGSPQGPIENRVSEKEVKEIAKNVGFDLEKEFEAGIYHYGLVFRAP